MLPSPRIVVIDDEKEDVEAILDALNALGTVAAGLHYSPETTDIRPFPALRILFLDLHLLAGGGDTDQQIKNTIGLVAQLLTPENGPYAIVLWSGHSGEYEQFKREVYERLPHAEDQVPLPLAILSLDKSSHLTGDLGGGGKKRRVVDPGRLQDEVLERIRENSQMAALLSWEEYVSRAADDTIRHISVLANTVALEEKEGTLRDRSHCLNVVLGELATASAGVEGAKRNVFRAANEVLVPVLMDRILHRGADDDTGELWKTAVTELNAKSLWKTSDSACAALHSFLHIEKDSLVAALDSGERGVVLDLSDLADEEFLKLWGCSLDEILAELKLPSEASRHPVMLQVQAPCDFAQARPGPLPYVFGICGRISGTKLRELKDRPGLWLSPLFEDQERQILLIFHLRFIAGLSRDRLASLELPVCYRLREQLLGELTHALHSHGGRPGIIRFPR